MIKIENQAEFDFWIEVYLACIRGGRSYATAVWEADVGLAALRERALPA